MFTPGRMGVRKLVLFWGVHTECLLGRLGGGSWERPSSTGIFWRLQGEHRGHYLVDVASGFGTFCWWGWPQLKGTDWGGFLDDFW